MGSDWLSGRAATNAPAAAPISVLDPAGVRAAARCADTAAETVLGVVRTGLGGLQFGAATAGRAHAFAGAALRREMDGLSADLLRWGHAAAGLAAALRAGVDGYEAAERAAVAALR